MKGLLSFYLPMQNLKRAYYFDIESEYVLVFVIFAKLTICGASEGSKIEVLKNADIKIWTIRSEALDILSFAKMSTKNNSDSLPES